MGNLLSSLPKTIHASLWVSYNFIFRSYFLEMVVLNLIEFFGVGYLDFSCCCCYNVDWFTLVF